MPGPPEQNKLDLWTSTSLVIGNMIGSGVFLMPAALAAYGGISVIGWIVSSIGALLLAKLYSNLSKLMPNADGGPYAYTRDGLGDFAGFLVAWGYWISIWCTNAAISVSFVSALSSFFPLLAKSSLAAVATGLSAIWFLTWINSLGVATTGRLQLVTTILKIIPLLMVTIGGLFFLDSNNFVPLNTRSGSTLAAIAATATYTFFAFLGLECATIPSGSVANPGKTIPRATMLGTLIATAIYILSSVSVMGMIPASKLQQSVTPFADAAALIWGEQARYWVSAGVAVAAFGALNGWILVQGQVPCAIARDKLFPAIFSKKNRRQVPATGVVIGSMLVSVLLVMNYTKGLAEQFKFLILLTTIVTLVPYLFSTAAYVLIKIRNGLPQTRITAGSTALATGAFLFSLFAMAGSGHEVVYYGFILLMSALPFYVLIKWRNRK